MTTGTKLAPDQVRALNKLGLRFVLGSLWNGMTHAIMLILMNFIAVAFVKVAQLPQGLALILSVGVSIFVFQRMFSIIKESHDRLILEAKKIINPK